MDFRTALRQLDQPGNVGALVTALGLEPCDIPLGDALLQTLFPPGSDTPSAASIVAASGTMELALVILEQQIRPAALAGLGCRLRRRDPTRHYLLIVCPSDYDTLTLAAPGLDDRTRHLTMERLDPRRSDLETLTEMTAAAGESGSALALRYERALDRSRVTARFFNDFRAQRLRVAVAWRGVAPAAAADRMALALLFLCRLLFLYFLQRRGCLGSDRAFLTDRWRRWQRGEPPPTSFYSTELRPLFFGVLNTRPEVRTPAARKFASLPYLNGGLFEQTLRERVLPHLDLPDPATAAVFDDLFERYRFTVVEPADEAVLGGDSSGVDPSMLGRVFEELMAPSERGRTGTFFTPPNVVDDIVRASIEAVLEDRRFTGPATIPSAESENEQASRLAALRQLRILDPACGSGAFLLGALARIAAMRHALGEDPMVARVDTVGRSLHGVDLQPDAALLCSLRLWLALSMPADAIGSEAITPLPNLDRRIRQGDTLLDPFDLLRPDTNALPASHRTRLQHLASEMAPLGQRYLESDPLEREGLRRRLQRMEEGMADLCIEGWSAASLQMRPRLEERAAQRDLWGERTRDARAATDELRRLEQHRRDIEDLQARRHESGSLPFFSFPVHFPEAALGGFDLVFMNPPWVRPHRWPSTLRDLARRRYAVCREPGWTAPVLQGRRAPGGQVDLAMLFLERAIGLLAPGGALGALLPAKTIRSLFAGPARRMLLTGVRLVRISDFSLDQRALFDADAFAMTVVALRIANGAVEDPDGPRVLRPAGVRIEMHRPGRETLRYETAPAELPLVPGDPASPWLLAPPPVRNALRRMQAAGTLLGRIDGLRVRRGVETGANDVLIVRELTPRLGGLVSIRAEGAFRSRVGPTTAARFEATVEDERLSPLVRGADIGEWEFTVCRYVIRPPPPERERDGQPHLQRYLARHRKRLDRLPRRSGKRLEIPRWRVAWHDIASMLRAVVVPASVETAFGDGRPPVLLNTAYQVEAPDEVGALRIAAFLNSTPVRVFAATIAERAKDAHFRFFAWTVSMLPIPGALRDGADAATIERISRNAHANGGISDDEQESLDALVCRAFGLTPKERDSLIWFGSWLAGQQR